MGRYDLADNEVERDASCLGDVTDDIADGLGHSDVEGIPRPEVGPPDLLRSRHGVTMPRCFPRSREAASACRARSVDADAAADAVVPAAGGCRGVTADRSNGKAGEAGSRGGEAHVASGGDGRPVHGGQTAGDDHLDDTPSW